MSYNEFKNIYYNNLDDLAHPKVKLLENIVLSDDSWRISKISEGNIYNLNIYNLNMYRRARASI
jgi:hypothetical protein